MAAEGRIAKTQCHRDRSLAIAATARALRNPGRARRHARAAASQAAAGILRYSSESFSWPAVVRTRFLLSVRAAPALG
jgi:hypothetical protein